MVGPDFDIAVGCMLCDFIALQDMHLSPGALLALVRTENKIPADAFARLLNTTPEHLHDIECERAPFPTALMALIFIYGVPGWYNAMTDTPAEP